MRDGETELTRGPHEAPIVREHLMRLRAENAREMNCVEGPKPLRRKSRGLAQNRRCHLEEDARLEELHAPVESVPLRSCDLDRTSDLDHSEAARRQLRHRLSQVS